MTPQIDQQRSLTDFKKVLLRVNYQTSFGQDLWAVGSTQSLSNWNPNSNGGRGGIKMTWTEGHNWVAEIPYQTLVQEIMASGTFEFKFVVKFTEGNNISVQRWEGGNENHMFDHDAVKRYFNQSNVQQYVKNNMDNQRNLIIGSFMAGQQGELRLKGQIHDDLPQTSRKSIIGYDKQTQALIYQCFW